MLERGTVPAALLAALLLFCQAAAARADNPFLGSYRWRAGAGAATGRETAERIRRGTEEASIYGRPGPGASGGRRVGGLSGMRDRLCARYLQEPDRRGPPGPPPASVRVCAGVSLFEDLLERVRGGDDEDTWFWDGRGTRRVRPGEQGDVSVERERFLWDGTTGVSAVPRASRGGDGPTADAATWDKEEPLPDAEVFYWHGPDQAEVVSATESGLAAIEGGAPAWFVSGPGYWEVYSWGGSTSFQITGDAAHEMFLRHGDRTLTWMEGMAGGWEEDLDQMTNPSDWLLYLIRNREGLEELRER